MMAPRHSDEWHKSGAHSDEWLKSVACTINVLQS
jgi:hypothetical protein